MRLGAVVLAAGAATRMGCLKQILPFRGGTLVEHAFQQAWQAEFSPVVIVLGARAEEVIPVIGRSSTEWVINAQWESGMGSSIKAGLNKVLELDSEVEGLAVLLADQPFVTAGHLKEMVALFRSAILAASYGGTVGVPALFARSVFPKLRELPDEAGAKALLRGGDGMVEIYELPEAATDIDTPADFAAL